jgi:hypothetical protein
MIPPIQQDILRRLASLCELSPDVRFGQLVTHLGFLAEDMGEPNLGDIQDEALLNVIERHRAELAQRQSNVA